jgi:hypothetical protein
MPGLPVILAAVVAVVVGWFNLLGRPDPSVAPEPPGVPERGGLP